MKKLFVVAVLVVSLMLPGIANAFTSGSDYAQINADCRLLFVLGVIQGAIVADMQKFKWLDDWKVTGGQARTIVDRFVVAHPELDQKPAAAIVLLAMMKAYERASQQ